MEKVFVTGASGLIGSNLCHKLLESGYDVTGLVRDSSNLLGLKGFSGRLVRGDVLEDDRLSVLLRGTDFVFHTAGLVSFDNRRRDELFRINVTGTRAVVNSSLKAGVRRLIHTSSVATIGIKTGSDTADEDVEYNKFEHHVAYGDSKHFAELEIWKGHRQGLDTVVINPGSVIGQRDVYFHSGVLLKLLRGRKVVPYVSGGMCVVGVDDVVNGEIAALKLGRGGERYILGGENITFEELFRKIGEVVGARGPSVRVPTWAALAFASILENLSNITGKAPVLSRAHVVSATLPHYFSSAKATRELGYRPRPVIEAIRKSYKWYIDNGLM